MNPDRPKTFTFTQAELSARDNKIFAKGYEKGERVTFENLWSVVTQTVTYTRHLRAVLLRLYPEVGSMPGEENGELSRVSRAAGLSLKQLSERAQKHGLRFKGQRVQLPVGFRDNPE